MAKVLLWVSQVVLKPTQARTHTQGKHLANMMLSTHWSLHPGMLLRQLWQKFLSSTELRWLCSLLCCPEVSSVPLRNYCWRYRHLCLLHLRRYAWYGSIHWQCVYVRWQCYCERICHWANLYPVRLSIDWLERLPIVGKLCPNLRARGILV